jgi:hypothetical protein
MKHVTSRKNKVSQPKNLKKKGGGEKMFRIARNALAVCAVLVALLATALLNVASASAEDPSAITRSAEAGNAPCGETVIEFTSEGPFHTNCSIKELNKAYAILYGEGSGYIGHSGYINSTQRNGFPLDFGAAKLAYYCEAIATNGRTYVLGVCASNCRCP